MEWLWVLILLVILFGPILWVFVRGRMGGAPRHEDALGSTAAGAGTRDRAETEHLGPRP